MEVLCSVEKEIVGYGLVEITKNGQASHIGIMQEN